MALRAAVVHMSSDSRLVRQLGCVGGEKWVEPLDAAWEESTSEPLMLWQRVTYFSLVSCQGSWQSGMKALVCNQY